MKSETDIQHSSFATAIDEIRQSTPSIQKEDIIDKNNDKLLDIMTFCNDKKYLNLPGNNFPLYVPQNIILKSFYMGTKGNENLKLNEQEWKWLYDNQEDEVRDETTYHKNIKDVIVKLMEREKKGFIFNELNLVLGRRGTKTSLSSIISAYEAYKLLKINNGDPHSYYNLPWDDEIAIINVALSQQQAGKLFGQVQARLRNSPFFRNRIAKETTSEIRLYTDRDLQKIKEKPSLGVPGSILILCGHSNPDTLRGLNTILILFDELAFYDESGKITGRYFYDTLKPSLAKFKSRGDGRMVEISSPNTMSGAFFDVANRSKKEDRILCFQLPTWCSNPEIPYESLEDDRNRNPERFAIEYGAQWAKSGTFSNYFEADLIGRCVRTDLKPHVRPMPGFNYHLHIDPAKKGRRYAAVLVAKERYTNHMGRKRFRMQLAGVWIFEPTPGLGIQFHKVDQEIIKICSIFHPITVSFDQYSSNHSLELFQSHGINCKQMAFNRGIKQRIYQNLKDLMLYEPVPELLLYDDPRLILELKSIRYKIIQRGISIVPDKYGEIDTDDISDCLAGACAMASDNIIRTSLPEPVVVRMGFV